MLWTQLAIGCGIGVQCVVPLAGLRVCNSIFELVVDFLCQEHCLCGQE